MNVTLTGATGLIGTKLVRALRDHGDEVTVLSRSPEKAQAALGVAAIAWDPLAGPAPAEALRGRDAVIHLAGEPVAQRWNDDVKRRIRESRETGTRNLVALYLHALEDGAWTGAYNGAAPEPVTNKAFSKALGRALHRPAIAPVPAFAIRLLYGDMAEIVTEGQRAVPERALAGGFAFRHADLGEALRDALA